MDSEVTVEALKKQVHRFCEAREWDQFHGPEQLSIGVVTEAAELLELFRFKSATAAAELVASPAGREKVSNEIADVTFFVLRFCQMNGIDLSEALASKIQQNEIRYPVSRSRGKNLKHDEL